MMKMMLMVFCVVLALSAFEVSSAPQNGPKTTVDISETRHKGPGGSYREQNFKVSQDAWVSKDGNVRAGGYVQHDRFKAGGGSFKDTHGGFEIRGRF